MIRGHGIDLQELSAIEAAYGKNPRFAEKVLTEQEMEVFNQLLPKRQMTYLAGRWAAKEACAKALGTGIGKLRFHDMEVLADSKGAPIMTCRQFSGRIFVSISHSGNFVQASVILEEENGCQ